MANEKLKQARANLKKIEVFCKSRPMKTPTELSEFLEKEGLNDLHDIAHLQFDIEGKKAYYLYAHKINRARL